MFYIKLERIRINKYIFIVNIFIMDWKWTDGKPYERSRRMNEQVKLANESYTKEIETSAYTSSLNYDENTWDILNQSAANNGFKVSNKREELGNKLADRDLIQQVGYNPFFEQNNYVDDVAIRDKFLKPKNTNSEPF